MTVPEEVKLVYSSLEAEAGKWHKLHGDMQALRTKIDLRDLVPTAFMLPTTAGAVPGAGEAISYLIFQQWMMRLCGQAADEFAQIGQALLRSIEYYQQADYQSAAELGEVVVDLHQIYGVKQDRFKQTETD